ncbi:NAD-dependent succinate-semialdehyde dehydrogenase [Nocardioides hungaricus]
MPADLSDAILTTNPATGRVLQRYSPMSGAQVETVLGQAVEAQAEWSRLPVTARADALRRVALRLRADAPGLAALATAEMGKPITEALAEIEKCAWVCDYYAEVSPGLLADREVDGPGAASLIRHEPLGVVLAVMPWNFPFWQVFRFAAPTLMAGNAGLLKHAPNVTGVALAIERLLEDAGLPAGLLRALLIAEHQVPATVDGLICDPRVAAVTLTGSNRAGAAVASSAARAAKKTVLELGGSDPFVVLDDADLDTVVPHAVQARFLNTGQSCLCAKRFLVHETLVEEFQTRLTTAVEQLRVGPPDQTTTRIGPLARVDLADELARQVEESVRAGAVVLTGGRRLERGPAWYAPTVLTEVSPGTAAMVEETFGPVAAVARFGTDDEAVDLANDTAYGLGASVWSADVERALAVGSRIRSGLLFVNAVAASDPRLPFGGVKQSGYGRELGAIGALEFTNVRTIVLG